MAEQDKAILQEWFDALKSGDMDRVDRVMHPSYVHHDPQLPPEAQGSRDAFKEGIGQFLGAFPDWQINIDDSISEGGTVSIRWSFQGTHASDFAGIPATNKQISWSAISFHRIEDGMLAESWVNFDAMRMMQQLGVVPS